MPAMKTMLAVLKQGSWRERWCERHGRKRDQMEVIFSSKEEMSSRK